MSGLTFTQSDPEGAGIVTDETGTVWAHALGGNWHTEGWQANLDRLVSIMNGHNGVPRVILWSCTPAEELYAPHPATWQQDAWTKLNAFVGKLLAERSDRGARLLVRTHARHALSDAQRCRAFKAEWADDEVGILLDPASMLEPSMVPTARDHFDRIMDGALGVADAVLVANVREAGALGADLLPCEKSDGLIEPSLLGVFESQDRVPAIRFAGSV